MQERIRKFEELLEKELKEEFDKINNSGTISQDNIRTVKDAVKLMLKLKKYEESLMGSEGEYSNDAYSTRRGRSATTGRYVSRDMAPMRSYGSYNGGSSSNGYSGRRSYGNSYQNGYSGHNARMIDELERMYEEA